MHINTEIKSRIYKTVIMIITMNIKIITYMGKTRSNTSKTQRLMEAMEMRIINRMRIIRMRKLRRIIRNTL